MSDIPTLPSDRQLVGAVRAGNDAAWAELMSRHEPAVRLVRAAARSRAAKREVNRGLAELHAEVLSDHEPPEGEPALRAFRPRAIGACSGGMYGPQPTYRRVDNSEPLVEPERIDDDEMLATAFGRLPEPWQAVLWHSLVEQRSAAEIAPLVGRTVSEVGELLRTAERGLTDAFLLEYTSSGPLDPESESIVALLGGYVRGTLSPHEQRRVAEHLGVAPGATPDATMWFSSDPDVHTRADSRRLVSIVSSLGERLPPAIAPGLTGLSVEAHRRALGTSGRTFGTAALFADRSDKLRRFAVIGSVAAVVVALVAAAYLIRRPFDSGDDAATTGPATTAPDIGGPTEPDPDLASTVPADTVAPTTAPDVRPAPTGPENAIELTLEPGIRPQGLVGTPSELTVSVSSPAPVFAGGTGTIDVAVSNADDAAADATIEMTLPSGVTFDSLSDGPASCVDPDDASPFCSLTVDPGATTVLALRFDIAGSVAGRFVVAGDAVAAPLEVQIETTKALAHSSVGRGDVMMIGNTVLTCADAAAAAIEASCVDVRAGTGEVVNRWDVPMEFIGAEESIGLFNSSSATLDLPTDSTVVAAYLYWSGDLEERGQTPVEGDQNTVTVATPRGVVATVEADRVLGGTGAETQYLGFADVTDIVTEGGAGAYGVGNIQSVEVQGSYGGWSLVVVIDDDAAPRRHRIVTNPFDWVAPEPKFDYLVDLPVPIVAGGTATLHMLGFEGERGFAPENLLVGGQRVGGENPFDSSIFGERSPSYDNNLGVDVDIYDLTIDSPNGMLQISTTSDDDGVRVGVLGLTVDIGP